MLKSQNFRHYYSLITCILFVLLSQGYIHAQIITSSFTNTTTWECREQAGKNALPLDYPTANGGTWGTPVQGANWPQECQDPPINVYPGGQPITTPGHLNCDPAGNYTSFFRTTLTLPNANPVCTSYVSVRADNYFRLWVNGTLVSTSFANPEALNGGTCNGEREATSVTGNGWLKIINVDITSFINPSLPSQAILFEVTNCDYFNYLSAFVTVKQRILPGPDPAINFTLNSDNELRLWGTANGWSNQKWLIEQSSMPDGPWSFFYETSNNRPGASIPIIVPKCVYIRITHSVWYACGADIISATAQHVLFTCGGGFSGDNVGNLINENPNYFLVISAEGEYIGREQVRSSHKVFFDELTHRITVHFNEAFSQETAPTIMIASIDGKVVRTIYTQSSIDQDKLEFDSTGLSPGFYFVVITNGRNRTAQKVFVTE